MKRVFNAMVKARNIFFFEHKKFIVKTEKRTKSNGEKTIYCESVEPEIVEEQSKLLAKDQGLELMFKILNGPKPRR